MAFQCSVSLVALLAAGHGCAALAQPVMLDPRLRAEVVATGLGAGQLTCSTGFFFVAPNTILAVSRADGRVRRIDLTPGQVAAPGAAVLDLNIVVATVTDDQSEYGVQALEPHPQFANNHWVYFKYDHSRLPDRDIAQADFNGFADPAENVIERYVWDADANNGAGALTFDRRLRSVVLNSEYHHGGPIVFGPDNTFYTIYGDLRNNAYLSKNTPNGIVYDAAVIVRLDEEGQPPASNPFGPAHASPAGTESWFAYGTRNSFGLAIDPLTGSLWQTDNGEFLWDEINRVPARADLGWDKIMGPVVHPRQTDNISGLNLLPDAAYKDPEFSWFQTTGVTGLHFLAGSALGPAWDNAVVVGNYNTGFVFLFRLNAARTAFAFQHPGLQDKVDDRVSFATNPIGTEAAELLWGRNFNPLFRGVLAIERGFDGLPYFLTTAGDIIRVRRACPADWNADGVVDPDDLADYIASFFALPPEPRADFNGDGFVDPDDLADYIAAFFGGC